MYLGVKKGGKKLRRAAVLNGALNPHQDFF